MLRRFMKFGVCALALLVSGSASGKDLVVDLSAPIVQITTGFAGTELLLFGAKRGAGDVVVVVRGPWERQVARRKERILGVWVNREELEFKDIPSYYWIASNQPVEDVLPHELRDLHQIGLDQLILSPADPKAETAKTIAFRAALVRNKVRKGLYLPEAAPLLFVDDMLFRTRVRFPANVSVGTFGIETYLVRDQKIVATETTLLNVRKFGLEAGIYDFAHRQSLLYGIVAVVIACAAGWAANAAFRRG